MDHMLELTRNAYSGSLKEKSFAVRCKRTGDHSFSSVEIERFIGHGLLQSCSPKGVNLKNPDVTVSLEVRDDDFYIVKNAPIPSGSALQVLDGGAKIVLQNNDVLKVKSNTASSADVWVSAVDAIST